MATFSDRVKEALRIRNMNQATLCNKTGIPKSAMSQYISGSFKPKATRLYKIAEALDVNEAWIMGYDVPMERIENLITKEEMGRTEFSLMLAEACFDIHENGGDADFQYLAVMKDCFFSMHVFSSTDRELLFQTDFTLNNYHKVIKEHSEYIPIIRKLLYIFSNNQREEINIIEKLFGDYNDHYNEMIDTAAEN